MRALAKCPICGHENERICFTEWGIGVVEDYYTCRKCSYAEKMAYSPYLIAVRKGYPKKYKNKVKERDIKVLSKKDYCHIIEERDYKLLPFRIIDKIKSLIKRSDNMSNKLVKLFEDVDIYISADTKTKLEQIDKKDLAKYISVCNAFCMLSFAKQNTFTQTEILTTMRNAIGDDKFASEFMKVFSETGSEDTEKLICKMFNEMKECDASEQTK